MRRKRTVALIEPREFAVNAVRLVRRGCQIVFADGPVGDIERDLLADGLEQWRKEKQGYLYLAANASWPGVFKIGCTRRDVNERLQQLSGAGTPTPWVVVHSWAVHDAYGLEAQVHQACAQWRLKRELFASDVDALKGEVEKCISKDLERLRNGLSEFFWEEDAL